MRVDSITGAAAATSIPSVSPINKQPATNAGNESQPARLLPGAKAGEYAAPFPEEREQDLEQAVRVLNEAINPLEIALKFSRDQDTGTIVIQMVDQKTGEVLRQLPSEVTLHLTAALGKLQGQIFDRKA
jgi:flagellar protein FlaG